MKILLLAFISLIGLQLHADEQLELSLYGDKFVDTSEGYLGMNLRHPHWEGPAYNADFIKNSPYRILTEEGESLGKLFPSDYDNGRATMEDYWRNSIIWLDAVGDVSKDFFQAKYFISGTNMCENDTHYSQDQGGETIQIGYAFATESNLRTQCYDVFFLVNGGYEVVKRGTDQRMFLKTYERR